MTIITIIYVYIYRVCFVCFNMPSPCGRFDCITSIPFSYIDLYLLSVKT